MEEDECKLGTGIMCKNATATSTYDMTFKS